MIVRKILIILYIVLFFIVTLPISILLYFINLPKVVNFIILILLRPILFIGGIKVEIVNKQVLSDTSINMYICNHRSFLDAIILLAYVKNFKTFFINARFTFLEKIPLLGIYVKRLEPIYIDKTSIKKARETIELQKKILINKKKSIIVFPEGRIYNPNLDSDNINDFHYGTFKVPIKLNSKLCSITLIDINKIIDYNASFFKFKSGKVIMHCQNPLVLNNSKAKDVALYFQNQTQETYNKYTS